MTIINRHQPQLTASDLAKSIGRDNLQYVIKYIRAKYEKLKEDGVHIPETDLLINQGKTRALQAIAKELEAEI